MNKQHYIHFTRECRNCGELTQVDKETGICWNCERVIDFYQYDEFETNRDIADEWHSPYCTCETCIQNHPEREIYLPEGYWDEA